MNIAKEILNQLGGNKFIAMTGAKYFTGGENHLSFHFPARKGANCCTITLNAMDTYDLDFRRVHGSKVTPVKTYNMVYNDMLKNIFTKETGLYLSIG